MDDRFDLATYVPVADRIRCFWERHPEGRIRTSLEERTETIVVFRAEVYRRLTDPVPAATGWAAEREGDGDINSVACLENTETSAIGGALANLGLTVSTHRPSAEEMAKASRARTRLAQRPGAPSPVRPPHDQLAGRRPDHSAAAESAPSQPLQQRANAISDTLQLLRSAERVALRMARAEALRDRLILGRLSAAQIETIATILRRWIAKRRAEQLGLHTARNIYG